MIKERVFVGVSGGIDSATSLVVLKERGYNVTGVYLWMRGECMDDGTLEQLVQISDRTGVEIIVHDVRERFERCVVKPFVDSYLRGDTPSPCADCNPAVKWQSLIEVADARGGGLVATGHYCRRIEVDGLYYIAKGVDSLKDQSYYMWQLSQEVLSRALFPLGDVTKSEVKELMRGYGWCEMVEKRESMGICFLEGKSYSDWLSSRGISISGGDVVDCKGVVVGEHKGFPYYTLAQKRGFTLHSSQRGLAVVSIDCEQNRLVVGDSSSLLSDTLYIKKWQFVSLDEALASSTVTVKVRGVGVNPEGYGRLSMEGDMIRVTLNEDKAWAVTKGQPAVFYINDRLIGGGIVERCQVTI